MIVDSRLPDLHFIALVGQDLGSCGSLAFGQRELWRRGGSPQVSSMSMRGTGSLQGDLLWPTAESHVCAWWNKVSVVDSGLST